ncbi:MAG: DUF6290 family protein [Candidatus Dormibacteria bacterium]
MTLRLSDEEAAALDAIAEIEGLAVSEVVRLTVAEGIERRRRDPAFQKRLRASVERHREMIDRLRTDGGGH